MHINDPHTGMIAIGAASATVVGPNGWLCDGLATVLMWWEKTGLSALASLNWWVMRSLLLVDMKIVRGASKVTLMKKRLSIFVALLVGFVGLGLTPAYAIDERVIDVVEVTWAGAPAPAGDAKKVASVIDTEVNADWRKYTTCLLYTSPSPRDRQKSRMPSSA